MDVSQIISEKGKPMLVVNSYKFNFHKLLAGNVKRWQCIVRSCKSFLKSVGDENMLVDSNLNHAHEAMENAVLNRQILSNSLKRKAAENVSEKPSKIINRVLLNNDVETITTTDMQYIRKNIYNHRRSFLPALPTSLENTQEVLSNLEIKTNRNEDFMLTNDINSKIVMFTSVTNLNFLSTLESLYVDGTFKCCPKFFYQLFTIHGICNGHYMPLVFFLLPDKTTKTYENCLNILLNKLQEMEIALTSKCVYIDFEMAIHLAFQRKLPHVVIKGCLFHLTQSWWRKIQHLGLTQDYKSQSDIGKYLNFVFGLPYLQPADVGDCFCFDLAEILPQDKKLEIFNNYLVETYISEDSLFPPEMWAEHSSARTRSTNACEAFHSRFNGSFYAAHPNIFQFIEVLKEFQVETYVKINSAHKIKKVYRRVEMQKIKLIEDHLASFKTGAITKIQFLEKLSRYVKKN